MLDFNKMNREALFSWIGRTIYCIDKYDKLKQIDVGTITIDAFVLNNDNEVVPATRNWDGLDDRGDGIFFESEYECLEYCYQDEYFDYKVNII